MIIIEGSYGSDILFHSPVTDESGNNMSMFVVRHFTYQTRFEIHRRILVIVALICYIAWDNISKFVLT
jgi:hypothetical protein